MRKAVLLAFVLVLASREAAADSWALPSFQTAVSPSRRFSVTVDPTLATGSTMSVWKTSGRARKLVYRRRVVNPTSPVAVVINDDGFVITFDNWAAMGGRQALVVYAPDGWLVTDSPSWELFRNGEMLRAGVSVSSRYWRYREEPPRVLRDRVEVTTYWGDELSIDVASGVVSRKPGRFAHLVRSTAGDLAALAVVEYEGRSRQGHIRCIWKDDLSRCDSVDEGWNTAEVRRSPLPRAQLRGKLAAMASLVPAVDPEAHPCAWMYFGRDIPGVPERVSSSWLNHCPATRGKPSPRGLDHCCADQVQVLRLLFRDPGDDRQYSLELMRHVAWNAEVVPEALREVLRAFRFDESTVVR